MASDPQASEGLVHLYCGEGKGKTTAAVGLCARAAGSGKRVLFVQFFKDGTSSENASLRLLPNVHTMHEPRYFGRVSNMGKGEFEECKRAYSALFAAAISRAAEEKFLRRRARHGPGLKGAPGPGPPFRRYSAPRRPACSRR